MECTEGIGSERHGLVMHVKTHTLYAFSLTFFFRFCTGTIPAVKSHFIR